MSSTHVRTRIRYDGPALASHEMDAQDLAPALLALADLVQITNRKLNGNATAIRVLVNADVEQRCFQIDLHLVQSLLDQAAGLFSDKEVKTAEDIGKILGLVAGGAVSVFKLIGWIAKNRAESSSPLTIENNGHGNVIITGNGNTIVVPADVYAVATQPGVVDRTKKITEPLKKPGYRTLEFLANDDPLETFTKEDALDIADLPDSIADVPQEDVLITRGPLRVKTPQYEGGAKWTVMFGGKTISAAMPTEWVERFQHNEIDVPPNTLIDVVMEQRVAVDERGAAIGSPSYTVIEISRVTPPPKPYRQVELGV